MRLRHAAAASVVALLGSGLVAGGLAVVPAAPGATTAASAVTAPRGQTYYVPVTRRLSVVGHGYGHGHGMSQHGAQGAALGGKRYREILGFYYPGTELGTTKGLIRVLLTGDTTSDVVVRPARGLRVRDLGADESLRLPERSRITAWRIQPARRSASTTVVHYENTTGWHHWRTLDGDGQFAAAVPLALVLPDGSTRRYRGLLRARRRTGAPRRATPSTCFHGRVRAGSDRRRDAGVLAPAGAAVAGRGRAYVRGEPAQLGRRSLLPHL
jgi:hypothetical protein